MEKLIAQGAEAKLFLDEITGKTVLVKERFKKNYRHPDLNKKLNDERTKAEVRCILKCKENGIRTPALYNVDMSTHKIFMEFIEDVITVKDYLVKIEKKEPSPEKESDIQTVTENLGKIIACMHSIKITHGDLTTSNFLIRPSNGEIWAIDFGLGQLNSSVEDMAVDLYVLERALLCTHTHLSNLVLAVFKAYNSFHNKQTTAVIKKLEEVRMRGRKRTMLG